MPTSTTSAPSAANAPDGERSRSRARTRSGSGGERGRRRRPRRRPRRETRPSGLLRAPPSPGLPAVIARSSGRSAGTGREADGDPTGRVPGEGRAGPPRPAAWRSLAATPGFSRGRKAGSRPRSGFPQRSWEPALAGPAGGAQGGGCGARVQLGLRGSCSLRALHPPSRTGTPFLPKPRPGLPQPALELQQERLELDSGKTALAETNQSEQRRQRPTLSRILFHSSRRGLPLPPRPG